MKKNSGIVTEVKMFCEICKTHYRGFRTQDRLKGKGARFARERGVQLFGNLGVMAIPHDECVRKQVAKMLLAGQESQVRKVAKSCNVSYEEYLTSLNL